MPKKLLLVGGGTGGHVYPLLNLAQYLRKEDSTTEFHWIGENESLESRIATENGIPFSSIVCGKLRRYFSLKTLLVPFQVLVGVFQSMRILRREKPDAIFSKGGYVSLPVAIAGWLKGISVYLHESDSIPGLANKVVAHFAKGIFTSFPEADQYFAPSKLLGNGVLLPLELATIISEEIPSEEKTQILIACGSQGSSTILDEILAILEKQREDFKNTQFHVILGLKNFDYRSRFEKFSEVKIYDYFYDQLEFHRLIHQCDIVIARSGSSIFEFEALGLHMILIPHPYTGNNHQYHNALAFQKKGHEMILQKNISEDLPIVLRNYRDYKKSSSKTVVDMTIFATIAKRIFAS